MECSLTSVLPLIFCKHICLGSSSFASQISSDIYSHFNPLLVLAELCPIFFKRGSCKGGQRQDEDLGSNSDSTLVSYVWYLPGFLSSSYDQVKQLMLRRINCQIHKY